MTPITYRAVFIDGRLEPIDPIELPDGTKVVITLTEARQPELVEAAAQARIFASLARVSDTGQKDLAERHNDHLP